MNDLSDSDFSDVDMSGMTQDTFRSVTPEPNSSHLDWFSDEDMEDFGLSLELRRKHGIEPVVVPSQMPSQIPSEPEMHRLPSQLENVRSVSPASTVKLPATSTSSSPPTLLVEDPVRTGVIKPIATRASVARQQGKKKVGVSLFILMLHFGFIAIFS